MIILIIYVSPFFQIKKKIKLKKHHVVKRLEILHCVTQRKGHHSIHLPKNKNLLFVTIK